MQLSRSKLRARPRWERQINQRRVCLRVYNRGEGDEGEKKPEEHWEKNSEESRDNARGRKQGTSEMKRTREREKKSAGGNEYNALAWMRLFQESLECGRGYTVRGCARVLHPPVFSVLSTVPTVPRPRGHAQITVGP